MKKSVFYYLSAFGIVSGLLFTPLAMGKKTDLDFSRISSKPEFTIKNATKTKWIKVKRATVELIKPKKRSNSYCDIQKQTIGPASTEKAVVCENILVFAGGTRTYHNILDLEITDTSDTGYREECEVIGRNDAKPEVLIAGGGTKSIEKNTCKSLQDNHRPEGWILELN